MMKKLLMFTLTVFLAGVNAFSQSILHDFQNNTIDEVLPFETGWNEGAEITVTVVDDPLSPGTGNNVMRTVTTNWNAAPALRFELPAGKTLADYSQLRFRGHFATGDVGHKWIRVIAYTAVPAGPFEQAAQQGVTIGSYNRARAASTAWEDITINIAGSADITGTVYLAFGFNNSASTWFADDVQLVLNVPLDGITVEPPFETITVAGGTLQMTATVDPANATITAVTWSVSDPTIATISATGLLTAVANGEVIVTATSVADPSITNVSIITVDAPPVGVPSVGTATLAMYPLPVDLQLNIQSSDAIERVEVLSIVGRTLISEAFEGIRAAVDMSALPAGTYIVRVTKANGDIVVRTIIKN